MAQRPQEARPKTSESLNGEISTFQLELQMTPCVLMNRTFFTKVNADLEQVAYETCVKDNTAMVAKVGDLSSTSGSMHQQRTSGQAGKEGREKKKMEGREGKEKGKVRGKEERKSHGEGAQRGNGREQEREKKEKGWKEEEEKVEDVEKNVTGWTLVTRSEKKMRKMARYASRWME